MRTALVTGSAGGIGSAIVTRLREDGYAVRTLDLQDADIVADLGRDALPDLSDIDVCVSNAGIVNTIAPAETMTAEQWSRDIDANLTGAFRVIQACLGGMRERGWGRVIVISSVTARTGLPGQIAYAASKAGLLGLVRTLATETVKHGITANAILPGMVATPTVLRMPEDVQRRVRAAMPADRMCEPAEVAGLVAYFASEEAGYVTGQDIAIDGGLSLGPLTLGSER